MPTGKNKKKQQRRQKGPKRAPAALRPVVRQSLAKIKSKVRNVLGTELRANSPRVAQILNYFISPITAKGFRWPFNAGAVETDLTATALLHDTTTLQAPSGYTGTFGGNGTFLAYLFRNPLRNAVYLKRTTSAFTYSSGSVLNWSPAATTGPQYLDVPYLTCSTAGAPHGPAQAGVSYLFCGALRSKPDASFVWLGVGDQLNFIGGGTGTPSDIAFVTIADNPGNEDVTTTDIKVGAVGSITTTTYTATQCGYYAPFVTTAATTAPTWTYSVSVVVAAGDVMAHMSLPNAQAHASWLSSCRINSTSILISNVASTLNVEGTVVAALVTDGTPFYSHTSTQDITARQRQFTAPAKTGIYGWLPPTGFNSMRRVTAMTPGANPTIYNSSFYLDDGVGYEVIRFDTVAVGNSYPGLDFVIMLVSAIEFKTDDIWAEAEFCDIPATDADLILQMTGRAPCFSENPLHLRDIASFVRRAAGFLRKHSTKVGGALSALFPAYATPINFASKLLQSPP